MLLAGIRSVIRMIGVQSVSMLGKLFTYLLSSSLVYSRYVKMKSVAEVTVCKFEDLSGGITLQDL